jgi:hypothetical protein
VNRRSFLKRTAAGAVVVAIGPSVLATLFRLEPEAVAWEAVAVDCDSVGNIFAHKDKAYGYGATEQDAVQALPPVAPGRARIGYVTIKNAHAFRWSDSSPRLTAVVAD